MDDLTKLREHGEALGYKDQELRDFINVQQAQMRDERHAEREREEAEREFRLATEKAALEREKLEMEIKMKRIAHEQEIEILKVQADIKVKEEGNSTSSLSSSTVKPQVPKIPPFEDAKDNMDSYLRRFERYTTAQNWAKQTWATNLSALLKGRALDVYALMPAEQAADYDALKAALLKRYQLTVDDFRNKFRSCRPDIGETFMQFSVRLGSYFNRWLEMSNVGDDYEQLFDLMLREQFLKICNRDLLLFLKERVPDSIQQMSTLADQYREARFTTALNLTNKGGGNQVQKGSSSNQNVDQESKSKAMEDHGKAGNSFPSKSDRRCYRCSKWGHIASECPKSSRASAVEQRGPVEVKGKWNDKGQPKGCGAVTSQTDSIVDVASGTTELSSVPSYDYKVSAVMPTALGFVGENPVTVLRDTGCSNIVVRSSKVRPEQFTGEVETCLLADGSSVKAPVAMISIDTPYLTGSYRAWCMESPLYDLLIGNVEGARDPGDPDREWKAVSAVETRQQVRMKQKPYSKLKVPKTVSEEISPEDIRNAQEQDTSLARILELAEKGESRGRIRWFKSNNLVYREYVSTGGTGKVFTQLLVPSQYRAMVMRLAHESIMSGHLATRRTVSRVLSEFYWPGIQSDIKRFCRSCDICQKTLARGKTVRVPLQPMPLIEEPFSRVAVDIVGPVQPVADKGNRYILTLIDYATRYPEAIALPDITTERVAEALVEMFSRIGVPREMLTDMGVQFTSSLMSEVSRLVSLKQLTTTPYHPMCNGLVERLNGTLKQMLKRMCSERPRDWDKYLHAVLFPYREVPQESLEFSPFELVYGRSVRGPMTILKELWTKEISDPQVRTTYQYVLDLKERLESTCKLAQENLKRASRRQRSVYNRKAKDRDMKVGEN